MKKHLLIATVICLSLSGLLASARNSSYWQGSQASVGGKAPQQREGKGNRYKRASAKPTNIPRYDVVELLVRDSVLVVIGTAKQQINRPVPEEKMAFTDVEVSVRDVLKGDASVGQTITVRSLGGQVDLGDGGMTEITMPDFWKNPEVGKTYVLFLRPTRGAEFKLTGGPQGLFEIFPDERVEPKVREEDQLMKKYKNQNVSSLIQEIRRAL